MFRISLPLCHLVLLLVVLLGACTPGVSGAPFQITEFLAVNSSSIRDEDGETSDWIEIHNPGTTVEFLDGWYLTDDADDLTKWRFPAGVEMQPNGFRVVFASDKNRTNALRELHTNFRLASGGEYLALVDPMTNVISEIPAATQSSDVSYGRDVGDPTRLVYYDRPTPGARNATGGLGFADEVTFSRNSGTFRAAEPFQLVLSTASTNAVIYYAFGTNVPGADTNVGRYTHAIPIADSAIVRARAFENGLLPGLISSQTYFALADDVLNFSSDLPLMIMHNFGQGDVALADQVVAIQAFDPAGDRSFLSDPPVHVEWGRFHVRGNSSGGLPKHSFFLEIQDEFGADKESGLLGLPEESDWALYAPYWSDPPMIHNPLAYEIMRDFGRYAPRTRFVEVFLKDDSAGPGTITSADYYGVFVLTEKIKRDNNRVAIDSLEPGDLSEPEITGGYLFSIDPLGIETRVTLGGVQANWISPRPAEMTNPARQPQIAYISNYFDAFTNALANPQWTNGEYAAYIDTDSWIDFHLHQVITAKYDALVTSAHFYKPRGGRITFGPPWDFDVGQGTGFGGLPTSPLGWQVSYYFSGARWWSRLFADPNFWQKWIDRYQELREGALTLASIGDHIDRLSPQLLEAQTRDQARWGNFLRSGVFQSGTFSFDFGPTPSYAAELIFQKFWYSNRLDFLDTNFLPRPVLSSPGGWVDPGLAMTISPANKPGTWLVYTLDGTDPRLPGGATSPAARSNNGPVTITILSNLCLAVRCYNSGHSNVTGGNAPILSSPWSGLRSAGFFVSIPPLRITELMYHPDPPAGTNSDEDFEYIEVSNVGAQSLQLKGFKLRGGIEFDFPSMQLQAGAAAVVVANEIRFRTRYGTNVLVAGAYRNRLDNAGERVLLLGPCDQPILDFRYEDEWYPITDGFGFSLEVVDPGAPLESWSSASHWRPGRLNGSPGLVVPPGPEVPAVVINEVLSHTDIPPPYDTVELHNLMVSPVNIGGWFLTDDFRNPKKYRIPTNTVIAPRGFMLFDETQFNFGNADGEPFAFSSLGDEVYLFSGDTNGNLTGYLHGFNFGPQEAGVTFGRHVMPGGEDLTRQIHATMGGMNAGPAVGPLVISEIMYHPVDVWRGTNAFDDHTNEFIELQNISASPVFLFEPESPFDTWRFSGAIEYAFPPGVTIPSGGLALVVSFDPQDNALTERFRAHYGVPATVPIFGPYTGKLDNSSDTIELLKPDTPRPPGPPDHGVVPYPLVERVRYRDDAPWPSIADGIGAALHRIAGSYGNDSGSWVAAAPSPGRPYASGSGPVITGQPVDATVVEYGTAVFHVQTSGTGTLIHQWRFNGQVMPRQTNATLVLTNVQLTQAGLYQAFISDAVNSISSETVALTVLDSVDILMQPKSQTIAGGSNVTFTVGAAGPRPIFYQWRFMGTNLVGQQSSNLTLFNITNVHDGPYSVLVSDEISSRLSNPATLTVLLRPRMLSPIPPVRITATSNQFITLGTETIGTLPILYRWRRTAPLSAGPFIANILETSHTHFITFPLSGLTNGTYTYTLVLSNAAQTNVVLAGTNAVVTVVGDADQDGLPDDYEAQYQFAHDDPSDASLDADGDGLTNREEFTAGTDPRDQNSLLRIDSFSLAEGVALQFGAISNKTYTLQFSDDLSVWKKLADILPRSTNRTEVVFDPLGGTNRHYRVATPRRP